MKNLRKNWNVFGVHSLFGLRISFFLLITLFIIILSFSLPAFSQQSKIDSIGKLLEKAKKDKAPTSVISDLVWKQINTSKNISHLLHLKYAVVGLELSERTNDFVFIASMYREIGIAYSNMGQYDIAIKYYYKVIDTYNKTKMYDAIVYTYSDIGNIYYSRKLFEIAKDVYKKGIAIGNKNINFSKAVGNSVSVCYNNLGLAERELGNYDAALDYFNKSMQLRNKLNLYYLIPHSLNYIANIELKKGNIQQSDSILNLSIKLSHEIIDRNNTSEVKFNESIIYEINDFMIDSYIGLLNVYNFSDNIKKFYETRAVLESIIGNDNFVQIIDLNRQLLPFYQSRNITDSIISISKNIFEVSDSIGSIEYKVFAAHTLLDIYNKNGDIKSALKYLTIYDNLHDSLFNSRFDELTYSLQKSEALQNLNTSISDIETKKEIEIHHQYLIRNITLIIIGLMIIFGIFFFKRYKLKNELNIFLNSVINSLTYPFYVIDSVSHKIDHINQKGISTGIKSNNANFKKGDFTVYEIMDDDIERIESVINSKNSTISDKQIMGNHKLTNHLRIFNFPVLDSNDKVTKVIEYVVDITNEKNYEIEREKLIEELKSTNLALENETIKVNELNKELISSEANLKILNSTKDKFFSIIAHDLKNPLGTYRNLTKMLFDDYSDFDEKEKLEIIEMMSKSANSIYNLLENLLEWSRSQRGKLPFEPIEFDLCFIVQDTFQLFEAMATNKSIKLISNIERPKIITADPNIVKTIIRNLVSNSIKFTPANGEVVINYSSDEQNHTISITDNGIGMSENKINMLFRIDINVSTLGTNHEKGTGLGLILCKEFVERHSGTIWVESEVGKGSTFYFTLQNNNYENSN
jgi:signal transduction histidine kinase